eukprot:jgi/Chlat1/436/Chrsp103S01017
MLGEDELDELGEGGYYHGGEDEQSRGGAGRDRRRGGGGGGGGGGGRGRQHADEAPPPVGSIHRARVVSVRPFGVFVQMEGFRKHGLVHISQVSDYEVAKRDADDAAKVAALSQVVAEGESIWVKVVSVKDEGGNVKVGCSIKFVNQTDGHDLDPTGLKLEEQQSKPTFGGRKKVELGAVYNVTCTKCGGHGHIRAECFTGSKYELVSARGGPQPNRIGTSSNAIPLGTRATPIITPTQRKLSQENGAELPAKVESLEQALAILKRYDKKEKKKKRRREKDEEDKKERRKEDKKKHKKHEHKIKKDKDKKDTKDKKRKHVRDEDTDEARTRSKRGGGDSKREDRHHSKRESGHKAGTNGGSLDRHTSEHNNNHSRT